MPWLRIDENAMDHPKIAALSDGAFRLWVSGLAFCQKHLTDGHIPRTVLRGLRGMSRGRVDELTSCGLWDGSDGGFQVHDYLEWNDSRERVLAARKVARERMARLRGGSREQTTEQVEHVRDGNVRCTTPHHTQRSTDQNVNGRGLAFKGETFKVTQRQLEVVYEHLGPRADAFDLRWLTRWDKQGKPAGDLLTWLKAKADDEIRNLPLMRSLERETGGLAEWVVECAAMKHGDCANREQHEQRKREAS